MVDITGARLLPFSQYMANLTASISATSVLASEADGDVVRKAISGVEVFPTLAEGADYRATITAAIARATALAADNGGHFSLKLHPGEYHFSWDGVSGIGDSSLWTLYNNRSIFVIDGADVVGGLASITLDISGCILTHLGETYDDWASVFRFRNCDKVTVLAEGAVGDYENLPFFQGLVTAIGADYIDVEVEDGTDAPSFDRVQQVGVYNTATRVPKSAGISRTQNPGTDPFTLADQGSGTWRVGGLTGGEVTSFDAVANVGDLVVVKAMKDGPSWFRFENAHNTSLTGFTCYASADSLAEYTLCKGAIHSRNKMIPRPGTTYVAAAMRGMSNLYYMGGHVVCRDNHWNGAGDDPIAMGDVPITNLTRLSGTTFSGFQPGLFFDVTIEAGEKIEIYDEDGAYVLSADITAITPITYPASSVQTFTISITAGAMPGALTGHYAMVVSYDLNYVIADNKIERMRGRGVYCGGGKGKVLNNFIRYITDEGILAWRSRGGPRSRINDLLIEGNTVEYSNRNFFTNGAIVVADDISDTEPADMANAFPNSNVVVRGNTLLHNINAQIIIAATSNAIVEENFIYDACTEGTSNDFIGAGLTDCVFGTHNAANVIFRNNTLRDVNGATLLKSVTSGGGSNSNISVSGNIDLDNIETTDYIDHNLGIGAAPTSTDRLRLYKAGANAIQTIETDSTHAQKLILKNASQSWSLQGDGNALSLRDETAGATRWFVAASNGRLEPGASNTYSIGQASNVVNTVYSNRFAVGSINLLVLAGNASPEGAQTAPAGSIYLRGAGGALTSFYVKESGSGNTGWVAK